MDMFTNQKIAAGLAMLTLNIGARYIQADLGKFHDLILSNVYIKKIIVFSLFFVATRDTAIAFLLTIFYIIVVDGVLHEKRRFSLIPSNMAAMQSNINASDYNKAKEIVRQYEAVQQESVSRDYYSNYLSNLSAIK